MSINNNIKFLENIKQGFKRTVSFWNNNTTKNNNLDYIVDPTLRNWLSVPSFKNGNDDPTKSFFDEYYMPLVEIKYFNALMEKKEAYGKFVENSTNNDRTLWNVSVYSYHQNHYKLININLSKQASTTISWWNKLIGKLDKDNSAAMFFYWWKAAKNCFELFFRFIKPNRII